MEELSSLEPLQLIFFFFGVGAPNVYFRLTLLASPSMLVQSSLTVIFFNFLKLSFIGV